MIINIDYANGMVGIYYGVFNNKPIVDKQTDFSLIKDDLEGVKGPKSYACVKTISQKGCITMESNNPYHLY